MSKPADGSASWPWSEFAEMSLFARVARRCYEDYTDKEKPKSVSIRRVLQDLAAQAVTYEVIDLEPRAAMVAANAARHSGANPDGIGTALKANKLRPRRREYKTTSYTALHKAFYRVLENLHAEPPHARNGSLCYHGRLLTTLSVQLDAGNQLPGKPSQQDIDRWLRVGAQADRLAEKILDFMLTRPDKSAE